LVLEVSHLACGPDFLVIDDFGHKYFLFAWQLDGAAFGKLGKSSALPSHCFADNSCDFSISFKRNILWSFYGYGSGGSDCWPNKGPSAGLGGSDEADGSVDNIHE
jgi:hypothetical protein